MVARDKVTRRSQYLTRTLRQDPAFLRLRAELDAWADRSPDGEQEALRWAVSLYDDAVRARVKYAARIRDVLQRGLATEAVLSKVGDVETALTRGTADATVLSVPVFGILFADARRDEARAAALLEIAVSRHITWPWLSGISGIGPVLAGRLLSRLNIHRAPTPASFWSYCGLATVPGIEYRCPACGLRIAGATGLRETPIHLGPDGRKCRPTIAHPSFGSSVRVAQPRPRRGESRGYDATARHACYLIGVSFVRRGGTYKALYAEHHDRIAARHAAWPPKRLQLAAQRTVVKRFLADLWMEWRRLDGLATEPSE